MRVVSIIRGILLVVLILLFVTGISVAVFHVPAPVMISHLSGDKKGKGMSFYMAGGELARTIGPLVAVGAVSVFGLEGSYPIMIFGIMASAWLYLRFRDIPVYTNNSVKTPLLSTCYEMRRILLPLTGILIARGFMHASMTTFLPTFIEQETGNIWLAGFALTALEGIGVVAVLSSGTLSTRGVLCAAGSPSFWIGSRRIILEPVISVKKGGFRTKN